MLFTQGQVRGRFETIDYSELAEDEDSRPLLLSRVQPPPAPAPAAPLEYVDLRAKRRRPTADVPRLSMLLRFEREHAKRFAHARRRAIVAMSVVFVLGMAAGIAVQSPHIKRLATAAGHHLVDWTHTAKRMR